MVVHFLDRIVDMGPRLASRHGEDTRTATNGGGEGFSLLKIGVNFELQSVQCSTFDNEKNDRLALKINSMGCKEK
jgi:hypothetical protein